MELIETERQYVKVSDVIHPLVSLVIVRSALSRAAVVVVFRTSTV